ncbi:MAG: DNA-processing protein DprA [Ureaplasma sp.]|nr:DNA-processing protein DprA [Ureaplasma sp.]
MTNSIYQFLVKYHGNWDAIYDAINKREKILSNEINEIKEDHIFIISDKYPEKLKNILLPPFFIFYKGDVNLINEEVISVIGTPKINELNELISLYKKTILCFDNKNLNDSIYQTLIANQKKFIVICEGGIDSFKYKYDKNILLISEYNNSTDYQSAIEQTIERILFAFANKIYFAQINKNNYEKITINLKQIKKPIYTNLYYKSMFDQYQLDQQYIKFIEKVADIT